MDVFENFSIMILDFIIWNANPDILHLGPLTIRWYGLLWALPFVIGYLLIGNIFKKNGFKPELVDSFTIYIAVGAIVGARLGHCFFYEPTYYLQNPWEILKVWHGGLASHGGGFGVLLTLYLFSRKYRKSYMWMGDKLVIMVALAAFTIRMGNLANSEIYGDPTGSTKGFIYARYVGGTIKRTNIVDGVKFHKVKDAGLVDGKYVPVEVDIKFKKRNFDNVELESFVESKVKSIIANNGYTKEINFYQNINEPIVYEIVKIDGVHHAKIQTLGIPNHPTQLYEGFSYLFLFLILLLLHFKGPKLPNGLLSGFLVTSLFTARLLIEFIKQPQVDFETTMTLNMGQWLSVPFILFGIGLIIYSLVKKPYNVEIE